MSFELGDGGSVSLARRSLGEGSFESTRPDHNP
jgi:hypothetical protein